MDSSRVWKIAIAWLKWEKPTCLCAIEVFLRRTSWTRLPWFTSAASEVDVTVTHSQATLVEELTQDQSVRECANSFQHNLCPPWSHFPFESLLNVRHNRVQFTEGVQLGGYEMSMIVGIIVSFPTNEMYYQYATATVWLKDSSNRTIVTCLLMHSTRAPKMVYLTNHTYLTLNMHTSFAMHLVCSTSLAASFPS